MHHQVGGRGGGKCLYIVPLRALASEKFEEFSGGKGLRIGIATGDFDRRDEYLGRNDIIVATSEKVDSLLRNRTRGSRRSACSSSTRSTSSTTHREERRLRW